MFTPKIKNEQTDKLVQAFLSLNNQEDAYRFLEDLCTIAEIHSMAQRLDVAAQLKEGETYQTIVSSTGASSATVSRVNRALTYGADGYNRVLDRIKHDS